jgi:hypothetical protein
LLSGYQDLYFSLKYIILQTTKAPQASMMLLQGFLGCHLLVRGLKFPSGMHLTFRCITESSRLKDNVLETKEPLLRFFCFTADV